MTKPSTANPAWQRVAKRYDTLGGHLRQRFEAVGADSARERKALEQSVRGIVALIDDLRVSANAMVRDRKLRKDVTQLIAALRDALQASVDRSSKQLHDRRESAKRNASERMAKARKAAAAPNGRKPGRSRASAK